MQKWKNGTGGGSGAPENYCDWDKREGEKFSNYAEKGSCDYLAYIYMLDQQTGFAFNNINDPAPDNTILEDGNEPSGSAQKGKRKRNAMEAAATQISGQFTDSMNSTVTMLTNAMNAQTAAIATSESSTSSVSDNTYVVNAARIAGKKQCFNVMKDIKESIKELEALPPSEKKKAVGILGGGARLCVR